jgi:hypothetical protein
VAIDHRGVKSFEKARQLGLNVEKRLCKKSHGKPLRPLFFKAQLPLKNDRKMMSRPAIETTAKRWQKDHAKPKDQLRA